MKDTKALSLMMTLLSELTVAESVDFNTFLHKLNAVILKNIPVDTCFVYVFNRDERNLTLVGSKHNSRDIAGKIILSGGVAIETWLSENTKPLVIFKDAVKNHRVQVFHEIPDETYEAFLLEPIRDREGVIGVLLLENKTEYHFSKEEVLFAGTVAEIISTAIKTVTVVEKLEQLEDSCIEQKIIEKAISVLMNSKGISESAARDYITHQSVENNKSQAEIAEDILLIFATL